MRILPDECLPKHLRRDLTGHNARTVPDYVLLHGHRKVAVKEANARDKPLTDTGQF